MTDKKEKRPSLYPFIEQTARILRAAAKKSFSKKRKYAKENHLSISNKIEQIALILRSQAKKQARKRKKKN